MSLEESNRVMEEKIIAEYDYYTLSQARKLIYQEMRYDRLQREYTIKRKEKLRRKRKIYYIKQRLIGLMVCMLSILLFYIADGTIMSVLLFTCGLWIIGTKQKLFINLFNDIKESFER